VRYLAVRETEHLGLLARLRHGTASKVHWHAIGETIPPPIKTVCGSPYTSEAHRTWDQAPPDDRCLECEGLVETALTAQGTTFIADEMA
jgi:hypothetical protein